MQLEEMEMAEGEDRILTDMLDIIRFTEEVSAKLHRVLDEAEIFQVVTEEFAKSERWTAGILLLADDGRSLRLAQTSIPPTKLAVLEKASGLPKDYRIKLSKAKTYRQVIMEGKTIHANVGRTIQEFLPRPIAYLISKTMGYDKQFGVLTPIRRQRKVIGILAVSCGDVCEYLTHSVENLALHISTALELAQKSAQRDRAVQALKRYHEHLGEIVEKRTAELKAANEKLREEIGERKQAAEALKAERNKLQSLVDALEYGLTIQDRHFNILYQNEPSSQAYGSHIGEKCYRVYARRGRVCEDCPVKKAFRDGKSHTWERRGTLPSGEPVIWENTANPIRDAKGKIVACLEITRNITERKQIEETLKESQEFSSSLLEGSPNPIFVINPDTSVRYVNPAFEKLTGFTLAELVDLKAPHPWWPEEQREEMLGALQRTMARGGRRSVRIFQKKSGERFWVEMTSAMVMKNGKPAYFLLTWLDITERKRAEEALSLQQAYFQQLFDNSPDAIALLDTANKVVAINKGFEQLFGYHLEEVKEQDIVNLVAPEDRVGEVKTMTQVVHAGKVVRKETLRRRKNGSLVDVSLLRYPIQLNGKVVGTYVIYTDITERKRAEEALSLQQAYFQQLFDNSPDAIAWVDAADRFVSVNKGFEWLFGYSAEEIKGRAINETVVPQELMEEASALSQAGLGGKTFRKETVRKRKDGSLVDVSVTGYPIRFGNETVGAYAIYTDITERKRVEEALRESEEKYKALFESTLDGLCVIDAATRKIVLANGTAAKMYGFDSPEEVMGRDILDFIAPEQREKAIRVIAEEMFQKDLRKVHEWRTIAKDGTEVWVSAVGARIQFQGRLAGLISFRDITERKQAEEALSMKTTLLEAASEASIDGILAVDENDRILVANRRFQEIWGVPQELIEAKDNKAVLSYAASRLVDNPEAFMQMVYSLYGKKEVIHDEGPLKDGRYLDVYSSPLVDARGEWRGRIWYFRDITERKKREQLQHAENYVLTLLGQGAELNEILDAVVRLIEENDPTVKGSMQLLDPAKGLLLQVSAPSLSDDYKELFKYGLPVGPNIGSCGTAAYRKERVIVPDIASSPLFESSEEAIKRATRNGLLSSWSQPIISSKGEVLGTIANYGNKVGEPSADNLKMLEWAARIAAIAIERKRAEEALKESERFSSSLLRSAPNPISVINPDLSIRYVNPAFEKLTGFTLAEIAGMKPPYPWWPEGVSEEISAALKHSLEHGGRKSGTEWNFRKKDGERFWITARSAPVIENGKPVYLIINWLDITERKRAEEALKESERFSSSLLESSPNPITVVNLDTSIRYVNPAFEKLTGFTLGEIVGRKAPYPWWPEGERERILAAFKDAVEHGGRRTERNFRNKKGERFWVVVNSAPVIENGKPVYLIINWIDITERKKAEAKEKQLQQELYFAKRLASVGELAAGVAHEINNPLTGVLGFSQRLVRKSTDGEMRRDLEIIHGEARRAAEVVQNLLTFARRRQPRKELTNINDILQKALELRAYALQTSNIEVVTSLSPSLPKVMADFAQMQEVFLNIILNAEQAMSEANGRGKLTIRTRQVKDYVRISFADDGPGIAPENIDKVFDPFFTTRAERGGTGLGLSASHGIVTEHEGRIYVRSKPGEGTTFFVELPLPTDEVNQAP